MVEAQHIAQRTRYDIEMMQEIGFCSELRTIPRVIPAVNPVRTLIDYFPKDSTSFVRVTYPAVLFMADTRAKKSLIDNGFRLPSAFDNRPLNFEDFNHRINQVIYVSATPGATARARALGVRLSRQAIRWSRLDPIIEARSTTCWARFTRSPARRSAYWLPP